MDVFVAVNESVTEIKTFQSFMLAHSFTPQCWFYWPLLSDRLVCRCIMEGVFIISQVFTVCLNPVFLQPVDVTNSEGESSVAKFAVLLLKNWAQSGFKRLLHPQHKQYCLKIQTG